MEKILFLTIILLLHACQPEECKDFNLPHDFEIPVQVSPIKNQYTVGDTIKVYIEFDSREVYDVNAQRSYDISTFEIFPSCWLPQIDTFPVVDGFLNNAVIAEDIFRPRLVEHTTITSTMNFRFLNECEKLRLEYDLVLTQTGAYCLLNCPDLYKSGDFPGKCNSSHSQVHFKKEEALEGRSELIELCQDGYIKQILSKDFETCAGFCFEVK